MEQIPEQKLQIGNCNFSRLQRLAAQQARVYSRQQLRPFSCQYFFGGTIFVNYIDPPWRRVGRTPASSQAGSQRRTQEGKTKRAWNVQLVFTPINRVYLSGPTLIQLGARVSIWIYYRNNISSVRAQLNQARTSLISLSTNPAPPFPSTPAELSSAKLKMTCADGTCTFWSEFATLITT